MVVHVSASSELAYLSDPRARLATMLFQQFDAINHHAAVNRLEHVVDGQQGHLHGGEGFHFNACLAPFTSAVAVQATLLHFFDFIVHTSLLSGTGLGQNFDANAFFS